MKNKLLYLINVSLKRKTKSKWFIVANILLAILIVGIVNVDSIITSFGGDFSEKTKIHVIDNTNLSYDIFIKQVESINKSLNGDKESSYIIDKVDISEKEAKKKLDDKKNKDLYLVFDYSDINYLAVSLLSRDYIDLVDYSILTSSINNTKQEVAIKSSSISVEELENIYKTVEINRICISEDKNNSNENMETIMTTVFPIFILPFFMLVIYLIQMIGAEVNDEKTTKGMEIIISNVSPSVHFFSKAIAGNLFVVIQGLLLVSYGVMGFIIRALTGGNTISNGVISNVVTSMKQIASTNFYSSLGYIIPLVIIVMILTFIAYSLLAGILASMTTNIEDFQQLQTPLIIILLIGYYLAIMAGMFKGSIFIRVLSYIPLISAILSPSLLVLGQVGIIDFIISSLLVVLFIYLLIKYGLRIYKVGILNYSSKDLWKKMFKALKD